MHLVGFRIRNYGDEFNMTDPCRQKRLDKFQVLYLPVGLKEMFR